MTGLRGFTELSTDSCYIDRFKALLYASMCPVHDTYKSGPYHCFVVREPWAEKLIPIATEFGIHVYISEPLEGSLPNSV